MMLIEYIGGWITECDASWMLGSKSPSLLWVTSRYLGEPVKFHWDLEEEKDFLDWEVQLPSLPREVD